MTAQANTRSRVAALLTIVLLVLPVCVFVLAGIGKLHDPYSAGQFMNSAFGLPFAFCVPFSRVLGVVEILLALAMAWWAGRSRLPAYLALCLLTFFLGMLLKVNLTIPAASTCGCYGSLMGASLGRSQWLQVYVDTTLAALLVVHLILLRRRKAPQSNPEVDAGAIAESDRGTEGGRPIAG